MIVNRQNLAAATTGFQTAFRMAFDGAPNDYPQITMETNSTTSQETYPWLGNTTGFREWIGDRHEQALKQFEWTIKNKDYENTVAVERNHMEDDQLGIYTPLFLQMGRDSKEHPDTLLWPLLKNGFTGLCYDGQFFFDTDHPVLDENGNEVSVSNTGGGSGTPWFLIDTTRAVKPLIWQKRKPYTFVAMDKEDDESVFSRKKFRFGVDARANAAYGLWQLAYGSKQTLDATSFNAAYAAMSAMKGDNGRPLGIRPKLLVVPPSLRAIALEVVKAERNANGATNINRDVVDVLVTPWLA